MGRHPSSPLPVTFSQPRDLLLPIKVCAWGSSSQICILKLFVRFSVSESCKNIRALKSENLLDMCWTITSHKFLSIPTSCVVVVHLVEHMVPILGRPLSPSLSLALSLSIYVSRSITRYLAFFSLTLSKFNKHLNWILRSAVRPSLAFTLAAMSVCVSWHKIIICTNKRRTFSFLKQILYPYVPFPSSPDVNQGY